MGVFVDAWICLGLLLATAAHTSAASISQTCKDELRPQTVPDVPTADESFLQVQFDVDTHTSERTDGLRHGTQDTSNGTRAMRKNASARCSILPEFLCEQPNMSEAGHATYAVLVQHVADYLHMAQQVSDYGQTLLDGNKSANNKEKKREGSKDDGKHDDKDKQAEKAYVANIKGGFGFVCLYTLVVFILVNTIYKIGSKPRRSETADPRNRFEYGHLRSCIDDPYVCFCAVCCLPLRWSDTVHQSKHTTFWSAYGMWAMAGFLNFFCCGNFYFGWFTPIFIVIMRHNLRGKLGLERWSRKTCCIDCLWVFCCPCFAVAQEALVVKDAIAVGEPTFVKQTE